MFPLKINTFSSGVARDTFVQYLYLIGIVKIDMDNLIEKDTV